MSDQPGRKGASIKDIRRREAVARLAVDLSDRDLLLELARRSEFATPGSALALVSHFAAAWRDGELTAAMSWMARPKEPKR